MKKLLLAGVKAARSVLDKVEISLCNASETIAEDKPHPPATSVDQNILKPFPPDQPADNELSTTKDRRPMNKLLDEWGRVSKIDTKELKAKLRAFAGVNRIDHLTVPQVKEACAWIQQEIEAITKKHLS